MHGTELNINFNIQELDQINDLVKTLIALMNKTEEDVQTFIEDIAIKEIRKYGVQDYSKRYGIKAEESYYGDFNSFQARVGLSITKILVHYNQSYMS